MPSRFAWAGTRHVGQLTGNWEARQNSRLNWPPFADTSLWGALGADLGVPVEHQGRLYIYSGDVDVPNPTPTTFNADFVAWTEDANVTERGGHHAEGWEFFLPNDQQGATAATGQPDWRYCGNCEALFWADGGNPAGSVCPSTGGEHSPIGWRFFLPNDHQGATASTGQLGWRYCGQCRGLCWSPNGEVPVGSCPAGGPHAPIGWIFALPNDHQGAGPATGQGSWRFCVECQGLFFDGYPTKGVCPGPLDDQGRPVGNGGFRLQPVLDGTDFYPFNASDPVGRTLSLELASGAFSHDNQVYVFANISDPRYSSQVRPGDPAYGCYLVAGSTPDTANPYVTQYQFSPRIGTCLHTDTDTLLSHEPRGYMFVLPLDAAGQWRMCQLCAAMVYQGGGAGHCFGNGGGRHAPVGDLFTLPTGIPEDAQNQAPWRRCAACQTAYWDGYADKGQCPAGGQHQPTDPVLTLPHRSFREDDAITHNGDGAPRIRRWRYCAKCAGLFWEGVFRGNNGRCPASGAHDPWGFDFLLAYEANSLPATQADWRLCKNCSGLYWTDAPGACPATGQHELGQPDPYAGTDDFDFTLTHDIPADQFHQDSWRFCGKCAGLFYDGYPSKGVCPNDQNPHQAGAGPSAPGFDFVLPHDPGEDPAHQENWRFCQHCYALVFTAQPDWFSGVAPYTVSISEHPGLPPSPSGQGLVLAGFSFNPPAGIRLAWLPLPVQGPPRLQDTRYWQGSGTWLPDPDSAANLVYLTDYTSVSLTWLRDAGIWVLLYSLAAPTPDKQSQPVKVRFAATPWDLATAADIDIVDPQKTPYPDAASWPYGPRLLERYTTWYADTGQLNLTYLLSFGTPYQIQLMQTLIHTS